MRGRGLQVQPPVGIPERQRHEHPERRRRLVVATPLIYRLVAFKDGEDVTFRIHVFEYSLEHPIEANHRQQVAIEAVAHEQRNGDEDSTTALRQGHAVGNDHVACGARLLERQAARLGVQVEPRDTLAARARERPAHAPGRVHPPQHLHIRKVVNILGRVHLPHAPGHAARRLPAHGHAFQCLYPLGCALAQQRACVLGFRLDRPVHPTLVPVHKRDPHAGGNGRDRAESKHGPTVRRRRCDGVEDTALAFPLIGIGHACALRVSVRSFRPGGQGLCPPPSARSTASSR